MVPFFGPLLSFLPFGVLTLMLKSARTVWSWLFPVVAGLVLVGCEGRDQIRTYSAARTSPPRKPIDLEAVTGQRDHILVAIVPQQDKAWFFKLVGQSPAVARQRPAFEQFLAGVTLSDSVEEVPAWDLPEGWQEEASTSELRRATLRVPDQGGPLELAVSELSWSGDWERFLVPNVNRWLGQLSRAGLDAETISALANRVSTRSGPATVFELSGVLRRAPRQNPHGRPIQRSAPVKKRAAFSYKPPAGWQPGEVSGMREAALAITDGDAKAEITVFALSDQAGPEIKNVRANMVRWAREAGLTGSDVENLEKHLSKRAIGQIEADYGEFLSAAEGPSSNSVVGAMLARQSKVWFFKLAGTTGLVKAERDNFKKFLDSVSFR